MFRSLTAAILLASGLFLSAAPASAQDWGGQYGQERDEGDHADRGGWERRSDDGARWERLHDDDGWDHDRGRHHGWWHHWRDRDEWDRARDREDDDAF